MSEHDRPRRARSHPLGVPTELRHERSVPVYVKPGTIPPPADSGAHAFYDEVEYERAKAALFRETVREELDRLLVPWRELEHRKANDRLQLNEDMAKLGAQVEHLSNHLAGLRAEVADLKAERKAEAKVADERKWDVKKMFLSAAIGAVVTGGIGLLVAGAAGAL